MGNKAPQKSYFNLRDKNELSHFISDINMLDGFYMDTTLSISSKCLVIINSLINASEETDDKLVSGLEMSKDENLISDITKLKFHCGLIRHLAVVNSAMESVEEIVELNNVKDLTSLSLDHVPIRFVQHLKHHRNSLLKLSTHYCLDSLESIIALCGGDHSFSENWPNLLHLDVRCNHLRVIDDSVKYLTSLTVLDISRNDIDDLSFIQKIPTLVCLNASFNYIRSLPNISSHGLRVLIMGYNYLDGLEGIKGFKMLSTLNISFNMISSNDYMQQVKEMDFLKDIILKGNPLSFSENYRKLVLDIVSPRVSITFAIDGKCLTKRENAYLRKRSIIFITPALSPISELYKEVPVVNIPSSDTPYSGSQSTTSYIKRTMHRPMIENSSESCKSFHNEDVIISFIGNPIRMEKRIDSCSATDTDIGIVTMTSEVFLAEPTSVISIDNSIICSPYYVGDKSSNLYVTFHDRVWRSFTHVSIQIIQHKFMAVDELNVTVENSDLWKLLAVNCKSTNTDMKGNTILKMIFLESYDQKDDGQLTLSSKTVEFVDDSELKTFLERLRIYLHGFSFLVDNWEELSLSKLVINCEKCRVTFHLKNNKPHQYICSSCSGTVFLLQNASTLSIVQDLQVTKDKNQTNFSPGLKKIYAKSSTSNFVIRTFGSTDSLQRRNEESVVSDNQSSRTSYYTAANELNLEGDGLGSQDGISSPSSNSSLKGSITSKETDREEINHTIQFDLDHAIVSEELVFGTTIVPHDCQEEYEAYAALKSVFTTPWIIHEPSYEINIHMHNSKKIDDRVKLYFLTKVMNDHEELNAVFKAFLIHKPTAISSAALVVISDSRIMIFNLLDKISNNMEECMKLVCEIQLKLLQQLEYCVGYQWIELQVKGRSNITLLVGDEDAIKTMGFIIADAATSRTTNLTMALSREISKLKAPQLLSAMTTDLNDGATMQSLECSECYLVRSCTFLSGIEKSSLEYGPKMMVIEAEHLFFITFSHSTKGAQPMFELAHTVLLYNVKNNIIVDSKDDCTIRLEVCESSNNNYVNIKLMSPHSRSKAVFCISKMLKELFRVEILYNFDNLCDVCQ